MPSEEEKARAFREATIARARFRLGRERAMAGSPAERLALEEDWRPLRRWPGWNPPAELVRESEFQPLRPTESEQL